MNWDAIGAIGESVGSIAVVITVAYLAVQIRQSSRHTKALLQQGQVGRVANELLQMANSENAETWIKGNGGEATPESVQDLKFAQLCNLVIYDMMDFYNTHFDQLTSEEQFESACVGYSNLLRQPGFKSYWASWKASRLLACPNFIAWADALAENASADSESNWV